MRRTYELLRQDDIGTTLHDRLPAGLYDAPRMKALLTAIGQGLQLLEDEIIDRGLALTLEGANADDLDLLGGIVGEGRFGLLDDDYRRFISARLLARKCIGTPDELAAILALIAAPCISVHFDMFAAGFHLYFGRDVPLTDEMLGRVRRFMVALKPAGVTMLLVEFTASPLGFVGNTYTTVAGFGAGALSRQLYP